MNKEKRKKGSKSKIILANYIFQYITFCFKDIYILAIICEQTTLSIQLFTISCHVDCVGELEEAIKDISSYFKCLLLSLLQHTCPLENILLSIKDLLIQSTTSLYTNYLLESGITRNQLLLTKFFNLR